MSRALTFLKYTGAAIVFEISYLIGAGIANIGVQLVNFDARGFELYILPYSAAVMMGIIGVYAGLSAIERVFTSVRPRIVVWVFIVLTSLLWGFIVLGTLLFSVDIPDEIPRQALQALVSVIAAWKLTSK